MANWKRHVVSLLKKDLRIKTRTAEPATGTSRVSPQTRWKVLKGQRGSSEAHGGVHGGVHGGAHGEAHGGAQ